MYYNRPEFTADHMRNIIKVTGEGSVFAVPDQAKLSLGVITENKDVNTAQKQNNEIMANVIHGLLTMGIKNKDIQTSLYRIEPQYVYENGQQNLKGYQVNHQLQVTVDDVGRTGVVIDTAVSQGANSVSSIQFTVSSPDAFYNRALSLAVNSAQQKAMAISRDLGVTLNRVPAKVTELSKGIHPGPVPFQGAMLSQGSSVPIQTGENEITARIEAEFFYTP
ncbi:SIMPL domain-containing protein [Fictibacillus sp. KIGAM418]|uniref:SIMPL domain-containing protein n=1 Tax=Fictibacillus marinisediminis TaxID=2878389 RepID=A0A9X1X810_9BACL|nr:SIMPL domain-containing protein [Fictibacillus marinisediminis]MCK6255621.1 SIMPL domain-containing protein [Fictibacillus marinisediminis]